MKNLQILLVDDEPDFLQIMGSLITGWGYDLVTASDGMEALDVIKENKPDIVVLDYMMPKMDGVATLKEIRKADEKLPVIMFTAYPDVKIIKGTEKLGISAFIPKLSIYSNATSSLKTAIEMLARNICKKE